MNLLLDTHVLLWWFADDGQLSRAARSAIRDPDRMVYVSAATAWEISIKRALGKLEAPGNLETEIANNGFLELPITMVQALVAGGLPDHHNDPFDRMLVAQAMSEQLALVSRNKQLARYGVSIVAG